MRLERVEISGFKSFCDRQEVSFQGGVTGIVGPNGCGKSNISDAISWVLGEQSAKSLRGTAMADVIFNGSQARQPVAMAEVNLKVSGLNGNSPDGSPEATVTRRLYRDGDSEYLMNGRTCRLRDIHELFMDTGLGSKAYSIIEQGKIGMILSTKPADRRALIEEAAGITKYKARRRQTSLKLDAAQQNLLRVNDIVHEVEKQLESLKRQASKARRWRVVKQELKGIEGVLYGRRFLELDARQKQVAERGAAETERERAVAVALDTEEAQLEARRHVFYEEESRLEAARNHLGELTLSVDRHQGRAGYCKEQMAEAAARAAEARREAEELQARVGPLAASLEERRAESRRLAAELERAEADAATAERAVREAAAHQGEVESEQEALRERQIATHTRIATLQNARESVNASAERAAAGLLKLAGELAELDRERRKVEQQLDEARRRGDEAERAQAALKDELDADAARAADARRQAAEAGQQAEALQSERDGLAGRLGSLEEIVETHAAFDAGVRALLEEPGATGIHGVVADRIEVESAHERAVEGFLGDRLQALLVPGVEQARDGIRRLHESGKGRASFLPLATAPRERDCTCLRDVQRAEPAVLGLLSDFYRVSGPHAEEVAAALPEALVFESLEAALDVQSRHAGVPAVTLAGEALRGATVEGGRVVRGLLAPRREVREIGERIDAIDAKLAAARARVREQVGVAEQAEARTRELVDRIHDAEKELVALRHSRETAEEERRRLERKASVLATERSQAEQEKGAAAVRLAEIEQALGEADTERTSAGERLIALGEAVAEARAASEAAQVRSAEVRSEVAALRERATATTAECDRLAESHLELEERIAAARRRAEDMDRRGDELAAELAESERLLSEALVERDRLTGEAQTVENRVQEVRNELDGRETALKERRRERDTLRAAVAELDVERARIASDLDHLARESFQSVDRTAAECAAALTDEERAAEAEQLEEQAGELRGKLERMGAVNVLAVEQSQELEERHAFLTAQRQDLLDSIAELESAVRKIDRASKERFREAFQVINQHFGEVFRQLFGGGTAGLSLLDETDILESGIDVMAQPPGKRLQNVMLLSGGEKALTAISLLFAIFQYKPSPFCILDEVDAPLDDANIGRFVRMLEGMKEQTQFVLITHSRRTMEIADQLYGVTMEEPGVSKLVSVQFG